MVTVRIKVDFLTWSFEPDGIFSYSFTTLAKVS